MKTNRNLLKEAIADAKAVKETAIANAKAALEEAFTPQIKSMLSQRLSEMEEEEDESMDKMKEYKNFKPSSLKKDKQYVSDLDEMEETDEMDELDEMDEMDEYKNFMSSSSKKDKQYVSDLDETDETDEEMDELYEEEEGIDEIDLEELLAELESEEEFQDDEQNMDFLNEEEESEEEESEEEESEEEESEEEEEGEESEEDMNIEDMDEDDLKSFIEDVIKDMVSAGDLAPGESEETEDNEEESKPIDEYSLEELLAEIKKINNKKEVDEILGGLGKKVGEFLGGASQKAVNDFKTTYKADLTALKAAEKDAEENPKALKTIQDKLLKAYDSWATGAVKKFNVDPKDFKNVVKKELNDLITNVNPEDTRSLMQKVAGGAKGGREKVIGTNETKQLKKELDEAYSAINTLRSELNEVNVLNAKLLYTNKIFKNRSLNETQKVKVLTAFDKANSVKEAKLVYETLLENLKTTKSSVNESLGFASKAMGTSTKTPIVESNMMVDRFKKLAGII